MCKNDYHTYLFAASNTCKIPTNKPNAYPSVITVIPRHYHAVTSNNGVAQKLLVPIIAESKVKPIIANEPSETPLHTGNVSSPR